MMDELLERKIFEDLFNIYKSKGFVTTDTVLEVLNGAKVSLADIDRICDQLLAMGVIIRDVLADFPNDDEEYDRGKVDYEQLYNDVLLYEPELELLINDLKKIKPPQHREWKILIIHAQAGNTFAYNRLCEMYLRTVLNISFSIAKQYKLPVSDVFHEGIIGLLIAIKKFNPIDNDMFPRYFPLWVRRQIYRSIPFALNPGMYFPVHIKDKLFRIYGVVNEHYCELCDTTTCCPKLIQSISATLDCTYEEAIQLLEYFIPVESTEQLLDESEEIVSDHGAQCIFYEEKIDAFLLKSIIHKELATIKPRNKRIVYLRYGFEDGISHTLEEIGEIFGLTRERIRQIEAKILRQLRHPYYRLSDFL